MKQPNIDVDVIKKLYAFGGLKVYRVSYFNPETFNVTTWHQTFDEDTAKKQLEKIIGFGYVAAIFSSFVKFDGAFSETPNEQSSPAAEGSPRGA